MFTCCPSCHRHVLPKTTCPFCGTEAGSLSCAAKKRLALGGAVLTVASLVGCPTPAYGVPSPAFSAVPSSPSPTLLEIGKHEVPSAGDHMEFGQDGALWLLGANLVRIAKDSTVLATADFPRAGLNDMTVSPVDGSVLISDIYGGISRVASNGEVSGRYFVPIYDWQPVPILADGAGNIWAAGNKLFKLSQSGAMVLEVDGVHCRSLGLLSSGNIVSVGYHQVSVLSPDGTMVSQTEVGSSGVDLSHVEVDASDTVWATDRIDKRRLFRVTPEGAVSTYIPVDAPITHFTIDSLNRVWILYRGELALLSPEGFVAQTIAVPSGIHNFAADSSGNMWVVSLKIDSTDRVEVRKLKIDVR